MSAMDITIHASFRDCAFRDPAGNVIRIQETPLSRPEEVLRNG